MANLENLKNTRQSQSGISQQRFDQMGAKVNGPFAINDHLCVAFLTVARIRVRIPAGA
jgi:hypothetical protein